MNEEQPQPEIKAVDMAQTKLVSVLGANHVRSDMMCSII